MASRTLVLLVDDIDGSEAAESVTFALDGVTYEIDLSDEHATELRETLGKWITAGRRTGRATSVHPNRHRGAGARRADLEKVRAWARQNGHDVSDRGRVASAVLEAYDAAHT